MKTEQIILAGAVAFAAALVAQKMGVFKNAAFAAIPGLSFDFQRDTIGNESQEEQGYDPANPGAWVPLEDLIRGVSDNDWWYMPPTFDQNVEDLLFKRKDIYK